MFSQTETSSPPAISMNQPSQASFDPFDNMSASSTDPFAAPSASSSSLPPSQRLPFPFPSPSPSGSLPAQDTQETQSAPQQDFDLLNLFNTNANSNPSISTANAMRPGGDKGGRSHTNNTEMINPVEVNIDQMMSKPNNPNKPNLPSFEMSGFPDLDVVSSVSDPNNPTNPNNPDIPLTEEEELEGIHHHISFFFSFFFSPSAGVCLFVYIFGF